MHPGAPEVCEDTEDMNRDGILPNVDNDEDGYISCEDCNDEDAEVYPGAFDLPGDGIDADCDGAIPTRTSHPITKTSKSSSDQVDVPVTAQVPGD